jgi:hypothetical protein
MVTRKTQAESEQPAKVYQLDAVETKVDEALGKLDTLIKQTKGVVTIEQLSVQKKEILDEVDEKIAGEVQLIHAEYKPTKDNLIWFVRLIVAQGVVIVGGIVTAVLLWPKG